MSTEANKETFATRDVSLAAYFRFEGCKLIEYRVTRNGRDGEWVFNISSERAKALSVEYANSDFSIFEGIRRGMSKQKYS